MGLIEALLPAAVTGFVTGLVTWGAIKVELRWLRRDVDDHHTRILQLERK